jgi:uncharacterized protein (TIGR02171 family)
MKKIQSAGKSFQQGWNNSLASYDEKPGMHTSFSYDYWLDTIEVTQKQYYDVTGKRPVTDSSKYGVGDNFPVYYVSWFDAVLYCNSRSRAEHLDTVYVYSGIHPPSGGSVYELTGLRCDLSRDGYRLPTESEWEFAARSGTSSLPFSAAADSSYACYYAWFTSNSSGKTHIVGTRLPNSLGLYDMAGNVFEWTNDWKCMYDGKSITNSLGSLQPGDEYEKVIKGGSYNYPLMYLRPSHRSATYATELSTACEYVGFRCARGVIPNGQYIRIMQQTSTNPINIQISTNDLCSFIGTSDVKVVFVNVTGNNRTLCYINFSRTFPAPWDFSDDKNVCLPTISPDGRYVAYCSNDVGQSGPSKITIRSLDSLGSPRVTLAADSAYVPRWWVNPATGDTCIVYTNSACDNGTSAWPSTKTFSQKVSGGVPVTGTLQQIISDGSYYGGISLDGQYTVTGYTRLMMKNLWTNSEGQQLFLSPHNGKDGSGSTQVCNVSISPDTGSSVRYLFLDFGSQNKPSTITNCSYGIHEYLFVSTMADSIVNYLHCPAGEQAWDNPKWSNQPEFAVGCGRNSTGQAHAIYAIDLNDKSYKQLVIGTELQQPYLWLGSVLYYSDSLGRYNDPPTDETQFCIATKLLMFWRLFDSLNIVAIGSSQVDFGFDVHRLIGFSAYNMGASGGDLLWQKYFILNYFIKHYSSSTIKVICSSLDIGWLGNFKGNFSWMNGIGQSKGFTYDSSHAFWPNMSSDFMDRIRHVPIQAPWDTSDLGCSCWLSSSGWGTTDPPPCLGSLTWTISDQNCQQNLTTISIIASALQSKGVHWIIINFPVSHLYKGSNSYSLFGPSWQTADDIIQYLQKLEVSNPFFHLYDANNNGNNDYIYEDFHDENHLSGQGAEKLSGRVDSIIHTILP